MAKKKNYTYDETLNYLNQVILEKIPNGKLKDFCKANKLKYSSVMNLINDNKTRINSKILIDLFTALHYNIKAQVNTTYNIDKQPKPSITNN